MRTVRARRYPAIAAAVLAAAVTAALVTGAAAQVADPADLRVTKNDSRDPVSRGQNLNYTITVQNFGPDPAANVVVTDVLPAGLEFRSMSTNDGTCTRQARRITCNLGLMPSGDTDTIVIRTRVTKRQGTLENTAQVESDTPDPVAANNSSTEVTTVRVPPEPRGPTCQGARATIVGTPGADLIKGTSGRDVIQARAGGDSIFAGGGRDLICAARGLDLAVGGPKGDVINGGPHADRVRGARGADVARGNGGADLVKGGARADVVRGNRGDDRLRGGGGPDLLGGGAGFDRCFGGAGADAFRNCER